MKKRSLLMQGLVRACTYVLLGMPLICSAQSVPEPSAEFKKVFSDKNKPTLCGPDRIVRVAPLIGELGMAFSLNFFALPPPKSAVPSIEADSLEHRALAWIVAPEEMYAAEAKKAGITEQQHQALAAIRFELPEYLRWLESQPGEAQYSLSPGSHVGEITNSEKRSEVVRALLSTTGRTAAPIQISCVSASHREPPPKPEKSNYVVAIRGKIDDLSVPRFEPGTSMKSETFKKASEAKLGYNDNHVKNEEAVAVEVVMGVGRVFTRRDSIFFFLHYVQSSTETDAAGDDDDSKDIRAFSPGFLYRHSIGSVEANSRVFATSGMTVYPTFDRAQDSRTIRGRVFLNDISLNLGKRGPWCDVTSAAGPFLFSCRLAAYGEAGKVLDAGRSVDLADIDDDEYVGLGTDLGMTLTLRKIRAFAPFKLSVDYRYMKILSGELDDPHRYVLELAYKVPGSDISVGLAYGKGDNFETFQAEEFTKLTFGFKY